MAVWFRKKFAHRLALVFCLTTAAAATLVSIFLSRTYRANLIEELAYNLTTQAHFIESQIDPTLFINKDAERLHALAHRYRDASKLRVTFIWPDGRVAGESDLSWTDLKAMDNHKDRPEIASALHGDDGHVIRFSDTLGESLLYAAVPIRRRVGVVRLGMPLTTVNAKMAAVRRQIVFVTASIVFFSLVVALLLSRSISRPVAQLSEAAQRIAQGDYDARVGELPPNELGQLGETLNLLARRVQSNIEEISQEKTRLNSVLSNMVEGVVAVDRESRIVVANPALCSLFGFRPEQALGKQFLEVLRHNELNRLIQMVLSDDSPRMEEVRTHSPDERLFEAHAVSLRVQDQSVGALLVLHDITRLRKLEQVRRDFVANVSHELRTPLASIKGFAETLRTGGLDDQKNRGDFVKSIETHADRMNALVEDLLDLTAIESGQRPPVREPVALSEVWMDVIEGLRPIADRKRVKVVNEIGNNGPVVNADRAQLRQVFLNLLDNALKFNKEEGEVKISAAQLKDSVLISVHDSGIGIPSQDLPRVFERFYRVDKARSREKGGTGLGLSIVRHIVEAHGGSVSAESAIGKGSAFIVRLPL